MDAAIQMPAPSEPRAAPAAMISGPPSSRTTSEAELGLVIGRNGRDVSEAAALDHLLGVVPVLDQTAEDILQRNPRFLTRSKNFPGFFSFGPEIVPLADVTSRLEDIELSTVVNDAERRVNTVSHMRFSRHSSSPSTAG